MGYLQQYPASAEMIHQSYPYVEAPRFRKELLLGADHSNDEFKLA